MCRVVHRRKKAGSDMGGRTVVELEVWQRLVCAGAGRGMVVKMCLVVKARPGWLV